MESSLRKIFEIFEFFVTNMMKARVCVYFRTTNEELMLSALVPFQMTRLTKSFIAHIAFVRFLVRVNTHVTFKLLD